MAKSDLLKEAIADAKAVKETALANAKLALQEAFAPRIQSMLSAKLSEELEDDEMAMASDEEMDVPAEPMDDMEMGADEMDMDMPDSIGVGIDLDNDGEYDYEGDLPQAGEEEGMDDMDMGMDDMEAPEGEMDMEAEEDELNLESIIAELEEGMYEEEEVEEAMYEGDMSVEDEAVNEDASIDELIEAILAEEDMEDKNDGTEADMGAPVEEKKDYEDKDMKEELEESYRTVRHLKSVINEVNLLNAKLLYTNKLFRNFELNESQKMKVIENFDRAASTREAKLVFTTLAESFAKPTKAKKVVKESKSYASKATRTTAPSKETTQILNEGFEYANRWKKLAGLI
jgi:hypothetical protein